MGITQTGRISIGRWSISTKALVLILIVGILSFVPYMGTSNFFLRNIINIFTFIILVSGFRLSLSTGVFSMAPQAFYGIGAYTSAILVTKYHFNWWLSMLLAGLVAALVGAVIGRILLRLKGIYFGISSLAFASVLLLIWQNFTFFGRHNGIFNISSPNPIGGFKFGSIPSFFYLGLVLAVITMLVMYRIESSRYGFTLRCIGANPDLAASIGVNSMMYRLSAFCLSCFFSGVAGAFFASYNHSISPTSFEFNVLVLILLYTVIGGVYSVWGPIYGVVIMIAIPVGLNYIPHYDPRFGPIILGVILIAVMLRFPKGLSYVLERTTNLFQKNPRKEIDEYADS